jgi:ubiquinone/menaquinone biosynthesis C-methylase UbiE
MNLQALIQKQFGAYAQNYVSADYFMHSESLTRLLTLTQPQLHWRMLDVATGGGHTALAFAPLVRQVVASDLTPAMLTAARAHLAGQAAARVVFCQAEACGLPFAAAAFDLVTCRIAPHHFADCAAFVREVARVLRPGGVFGLIDGATPADPRAARHLNAFEKLRDPSHNWEYTAGEWESFVGTAGLRVAHREIFQRRVDFDEYCNRMNAAPRVRQQLRVMLRHAPAAALAALQPQFPAGEAGPVSFCLREVLLVAHKA